MKICFAPMQGYADYLYRRCHALTYGPADEYYTPFIRIEKGDARRQDISWLEKSIGDGTNLIPQIIFNSAQEFTALVEALKERGFNRIDLNLGCPYPMQTRKGRGAAAMVNLTLMEEISRLINDDSGTAYSIKMRLGVNEPDEWRQAMPILNKTNLTHIALHPRTGRQMYDGEIFEDQFAAFLSESNNPVIWNGGAHTIADIDECVSKYQSLQGVMIGRGFLARPSLAAEWKDGCEWDKTKRMERLLYFHDMLLENYEETLCGQTQILQKIKPFWEYLEPTIGHKTYKSIHKSTTLEKYKAIIAGINANC